MDIAGRVRRVLPHNCSRVSQSKPRERVALTTATPPVREPHLAAAMLGARVHVIGMSSSGKTTLARRLAKAAGAELVDLDALNWLPNWVGLNDTNKEELERRFRAATTGERWVSAGSYRATAQRAFWPRLETIVWLDLPVALCVWRMLRRSWRHWRSGELLWGVNRERFWPHLMVWRQADSLLWWIVTQHQRRRRECFQAMADPRWSHIRFVRLASRADVEAFARAVERRLTCRRALR